MAQSNAGDARIRSGARVRSLSSRCSTSARRARGGPARTHARAAGFGVAISLVFALAGCAGVETVESAPRREPVAAQVSASELAAELHLERVPSVEGRVVLASSSGDAILLFPDTTVVSVRGTTFTAAEPIALRGDEVWVAKADADAIENLWRTIPALEAPARTATVRSPDVPRFASRMPYSDQPTASEVRAWSVSRLSSGWRYIVIHHSATDSGSASSFDKAHRARGWDGLGYDFVIGNGNGSSDGAVEVGYRWREQKRGAHAGNDLFNEHGIGICLVGDFTRTDPSPAQMRALSRLCNFLSGYCHIPRENYRLHGDVRTTTCPGPRFPRDFLSERSAIGLRAHGAGSDQASGSGR
jgi:N-acetylmuramoyl-L-alanine amidase-like protein